MLGMGIMAFIQILLSVLSLLSYSVFCEEDPGFDIFIGTTVLDEAENRPITFEKPLPKWLKGSLIRNGPARYEMGSRKFLNVFDAFGKLNKWTFPGNGSAFFSAKFAGTNFYNKSVAKNDIAPYQIFDLTIPPMTKEQSLISLVHGMDNTNINVYNYSDGCVILSDTWRLYSIDCQSLVTMQSVRPPIRNDDLGVGLINIMSSAHPIPEVGTSNHFVYLTSMSIVPGVKHRITFFRITSTAGREEIGSFEVDQAPYLHSFSATKNFLIILAHPYNINVFKMMETGSPKESIEWHDDMPAKLYVMGIKTGKLHTFQTETVFSMHHINAYEPDDTKSTLFVDVAAYTDSSLVDKFEITTILDKTKRDSLNWQPTTKRFVIELSKKDVKVLTFENSPSVPFASNMEVPTINEAYRSSPYCFVYGLVFKSDNLTFANFSFVKKDLCNSTGDRVWSNPGHYPMEAWFVPDPQGVNEDDGLIFLPVMDGVKKRSYLAILDARTLTLINKSYTPFVVPFHFHGRFFPHLSN